MQSELKQMENKIIADLAKYQKFKYHFLIGNLLFRSAIVNDTSAIVNKKNFLNEAKNALGSCKLHKRYQGINQTEITDGNLVKRNSKVINVNLIDSKDCGNANHFSFGFTTKNFPRYNKLYISIIRRQRSFDKIQLNRRKSRVLGFKIQFLK